MQSYVDRVSNCIWLQVLQEQLSRKNPSEAHGCLWIRRTSG